MTGHTPLVIALTLLAGVGCWLAPAHAQAVLEAQVGWNGTPPQGVEFVRGNVQTKPFEPRRTYFYGRREYRRLNATEDFVVFWRDLRMTFRARAQVPDRQNPGDSFRVTRPRTDLPCNNDPIDALARQAHHTDTDSRIALMLQAHFILVSGNEPCSEGHRRRLAAILFIVNCDLAKETDFFDLSPEVVSIYSEAHRNSPDVRERIQACRDEINGLIAKAGNDASVAALRDRDFERFEDLNGKLIELRLDPDFARGFELQGISLIDLQHRQIESLNRQFEAGLLNSDPSAATAERMFEAARSLDRLSRDPSYAQAFRNAGLPIASARAFPGIAERRLNEVQ